MSGQRKKTLIRGVWNVVRRCGLGACVLALYPKSALVQNGWFKSYRRGEPVDSEGRPLPWLPYSMIDFLESRLSKDLTLFEYGCGFSTLWYCSKVKQVTSVENSRDWSARIGKMLPPNGCVLYRESPEEFVRAIEEVGKVDVVIVDGIARMECYQNLNSYLTEKGVIIADDSEREDFAGGWKALQTQGFKKITFTGLTPSHFVKSQTSVLYRPDNCLGI